MLIMKPKLKDFQTYAVNVVYSFSTNNSAKANNFYLFDNREQ